jgi:hypothetical protein
LVCFLLNGPLLSCRSATYPEHGHHSSEVPHLRPAPPHRPAPEELHR